MASEEDTSIQQNQVRRAPGILERPERPRTQFSMALTKLINDPGYRERATADPAIVTRDFKLSLRDLEALHQAAIMSGADVTEVDKYRAGEILARAGQISAAAINISCCSCCCCCCGETAVAPMISK